MSCPPFFSFPILIIILWLAIFGLYFYYPSYFEPVYVGVQFGCAFCLFLVHMARGIRAGVKERMGLVTGPKDDILTPKFTQWAVNA